MAEVKSEPHHPLIEIEDVQKSTLEKAPIIHEYVVPEHTTVVQPIIHREILKTEVRRVTQPIYEEISRPVQVHENELPTEIKEKIEKGNIPLDTTLTRNEGYEPKIITTYAAPVIKKVVLQPIIYETIIPEIIEEIQPIIHRTVHEAHMVKKQELIVESVDRTIEVTETDTTRETLTTTASDTAFDVSGVKVELHQIEATTKLEGLVPSV